jgi:hypothetical protein
MNTATIASVVEQVIAIQEREDQELIAAQAAVVSKPKAAKRTRKASKAKESAKAPAPVTIPEQIVEQTLRERFIQGLREEQARVNRPLTQLDRIAVFIFVQTARGVTYTNKKVAFINMLACYHNWQIHEVSLEKTQYRFNRGLRKDSIYRAIEQDMQAWLNS